MRVPTVTARSSLVLLLLVMMVVLAVKYSIDQHHIEVSQLSSQLSLLKSR